MKVYRPCLLLSIMSDYAFWKTNAFGYFATNILFFIASAIALYMVLRELTCTWNHRQSILFASFSAALFASSPLHCESISLMVGRVDIICAFFYLFALWTFLRKGDTNNWPLTFLTILCFWIAMLTKEMAIGLPVVMTAIALLFPKVLAKKSERSDIYKSTEKTLNFYQRINLAAQTTYPIWLSCVFYFIIRYCALGTLLGGYIGSVGANQFGHILEKWTDLGTIDRIIFPFNQAVFLEHEHYRQILLLIYCALGILVFAKFIQSETPRNWLLLLIIWTITVLAPIYQLWGLGFNLEGARFLFFLTIPLSILLPLLIFSPSNNNFANTPLNSLTTNDLKILAPGTLLLFALVFLYTITTAKNNIPWVHAGKQVKALLQEGQKLAESISAAASGQEQKAIVLGIPKEIDGAHVIYNGLTFNFLMAPPFSPKDYSTKFITFDPVLFGNSNLINTARFKKEIANPNLNGCYLWQTEKMAFDKVTLPTEPINETTMLSLSFSLLKSELLPITQQRGSWEFQKDRINIYHCEKGTGIACGPTIIDPFTYDFMEIEAAARPAINSEQIKVYWQTDYLNPEQNKNVANGSSFYLANISNESNKLISSNAESLPNTNNTSTEYKIYRIPLSRNWRWFTNAKIRGLWLEFPPLQSISIKNIRLLTPQSIVPKLEVADLQSDNTGVYQLSRKALTVKIDTSKVKDCVATQLQISKPNYFFDNFDCHHTEQAVLNSIALDNTAGELFIGEDKLPSAGYYQIRLIGLDKDGNTVGEWSDPITIKL